MNLEERKEKWPPVLESIPGLYGEEEYLCKQQLERMRSEEMIRENICPECWGDILEYHEPNLLHDYNRVGVCKGCGNTFT